MEQEVGGRAIFTCRSDTAPIWVHNKRGLGVTYPYTHSNWTLEVPSVQLWHAGLYTCYVDNLYQKYLARAELVVYGELDVLLIQSFSAEIITIIANFLVLTTNIVN